MSCEACDAHAANPLTGLVNANCRQCKLREIVRGQEFQQSYWKRARTPEYVKRLVELGDEETVHREVLAVAKTLYTGARG